MTKKKEKRANSSANANEVVHALNEMVDVSKFFRTYCYRSVVEQGFSLNEIDVLVSLKEHPEKNTVKGISETMHLSKGMISQAVESLRRKKMVTVNQNQDDRRSVLIHLNQRSHPILEKLRESSNGFVDRIISGLSREQLDAITNAMAQIRKNKEDMKLSTPKNESET